MQVLLLRLEGANGEQKVEIIKKILREYADKIETKNKWAIKDLKRRLKD